jgi:hypothetical protein
MNNDEGYDWEYDRKPTEFELWYARQSGRRFHTLSNNEKSDVLWRYKEYQKEQKEKEYTKQKKIASVLPKKGNMVIEKRQFTKHDSELHPECNNSRYLDYQKVTTGLSESVISYGYILIDKISYRWITKVEAKNIKRISQKEPI